MPYFYYTTSLFTGTCTKACQKRCLISRSLSVLLVTRARSLVTVPGSVTGVVGFPISVPCDLTPPSPGDSPHLILWYKNIFGTPIYRCGQITITKTRLWLGLNLQQILSLKSHYLSYLSLSFMNDKAPCSKRTH